jgi:hypothetical protein
MATPLADLLRSVLTDDTMRLAAGRSPGAFLRDHGWEHLDAADLREAMLVLADGAPTAEAVVWVGGSDAIDIDADPADALTAATATFPSDLVADDPIALDDIDDPHDDGPDTDDDVHDDHAGDAGDAASDELDDATGGGGTDVELTDVELTDIGSDGDEAIDLDTDGTLDPDPFETGPPDGPERFADAEGTATDDEAPAPGELGDGWDDLI